MTLAPQNWYSSWNVVVVVVVVVADVARSRHHRGDRGVEKGAALSSFAGPLRHKALLVFRRHPGVAPWLPHVRLSDGNK
jgi:hypothetical protein